MHSPDLTDVEKRGLKFIATQQLPNGGFGSYMSTGTTIEQSDTMYQTTFFPSLIMSALAALPQAIKIQNKTARFIEDQLSNNLSCNYWDRSSKLYSQRPLPDDLDDTFIGLAAIWRHNKSFFTGHHYAAVTQLLTACEAKVGGPYRTWLVKTDATDEWKEVDIAVNANIAYFLSLEDVVLPNLTEFIDEAIRSNRFTSVFYLGSYPVLYFIARGYHGAERKKLIQQLQLVQPKTAHDTALVLSSLIRLGSSGKYLEKYVDTILQQQHSNGSWSGRAFCVDSINGNTTRYNGADALTTALCLEAIGLYTKCPAAKSKVIPPTHQSVVSAVKDTIEQLPGQDLKSVTHKILRNILVRDTDYSITGLPCLVAKATKVAVKPRILEDLAEINLWGWMAYMTYDAFLDNEGNREELPSANTCLRYLGQKISATLPSHPEFQTEALQIMNRLDAANAWELAHCRAKVSNGKLQLRTLPDYGDYWQLADRSLGHTIAGLGVLFADGYSSGSTQMEAMRGFFTHYLIARQLNDDAHDWEADLWAGHINAVAVLILHELRLTTSQSIDLKKKRLELRDTFWNSSIDTVSSLIHEHVRLARYSLALSPSFFDVVIFEKLLSPLESSAHEAVTQRTNAKQFITNFEI